MCAATYFSKYGKLFTVKLISYHNFTLRFVVQFIKETIQIIVILQMSSEE